MSCSGHGAGAARGVARLVGSNQRGHGSCLFRRAGHPWFSEAHPRTARAHNNGRNEVQAIEVEAIGRDQGWSVDSQFDWPRGRV